MDYFEINEQKEIERSLMMESFKQKRIENLKRQQEIDDIYYYNYNLARIFY